MRGKMKKDHKMKSGKREIPQSICTEPGCKFEGKPAAQGVCYSRIPRKDDAYIRQVMRNGEALLKEMKALRVKNKATAKDEWIKHLEGQVVCTWANNHFMLDELVSLRAQNAELKLKIGKWDGR
jgi:hypothetical protein